MKLRKILSLGLVLIVVISSIMVGVVSVGAASIDKTISVTLTNTQQGIIVSWGDVKQTDKVRVFYKPSGTTKWNSTDVEASKHYTTLSAEDGKLIYIQLGLLNKNEVLTSYSSVKSITYRVPINLSLKVTSSGVSASWTSVGKDAKYWVYWNEYDKTGWNKKYVGKATGTLIPNDLLTSGKKYKVQVLDFDTSVRNSGRMSKVRSYTYLENVRVDRTVFVGNKLYVGYTPSSGANAYQVAYKKYGTSDKYTYKVVDKWSKRTTSDGKNEYFLSVDLPSYLASSDVHVQVRPMLKTANDGTAYGAYSATKCAKTPVVNKNKTKRQLEVEIANSLRKRLKGIPYTDNMVAAFLTAVNHETGFKYECVFNVTAISSTNSWSDIIDADACGGMIPVSFKWCDDFLKTNWQASVDAQVDYLVGKLNERTNWQKHTDNAKDCLNCIMTEWVRPAYYEYDRNLEAMLITYGGTVNSTSGNIK